MVVLYHIYSVSSSILAIFGQDNQYIFVIMPHRAGAILEDLPIALHPLNWYNENVRKPTVRCGIKPPRGRKKECS
jgi:hypothetical protein